MKSVRLAKKPINMLGGIGKVASILLSKSKYLNGLQCPKLLWLEINNPERLPQVDLSTQFIFDQGNLVGTFCDPIIVHRCSWGTKDMPMTSTRIPGC